MSEKIILDNDLKEAPANKLSKSLMYSICRTNQKFLESQTIGQSDFEEFSLEELEEGFCNRRMCLDQINSKRKSHYPLTEFEQSLLQSSRKNIRLLQ